ncbi:MAG: hypothetical protein KAS97_05460 [Candidatus Aminicenantes bacterium]|nr:hypothetical protein [Candidatus Aminicenantes bacterium]
MKIILPVIFILIFSLSAHAEPVENFGLTGIEQNTIRNGELVYRKKEIKGTPWPEITVFGIIKATALESTAVFYAYHEHKEFLPDLLSSVPVRYISPTDLHIKFEMKVPWPLRNSRYITGNRFSTYGDGGYRIEWYNVTSSSSKDTNGAVTFLPYEQRTMFIYRTFIHPKSKLAGLFKKRMLKEVLISVRAIISRIESVKNNNKEKMPGYITAVNSSLNGEYVYKGIQGAGD